ncbi:glycosyltransferase family A protein [Bacteroides sp. CR5/BHMF/2]|nr:glycosyltransferase family A protein [Bacteroides sp. CR5/BHMF/2]
MVQTYTDYEIILLDDASTDDSVSILNHYKTNSRVAHLEINSVNTGSPFAQWQKGLVCLVENIYGLPRAMMRLILLFGKGCFCLKSISSCFFLFFRFTLYRRERE